MAKRQAFRRAVALSLAALTIAGCVDTAERYRTYSETVAAMGGLRTETAPPDAPFDNEDLIRNFERIAFFTEYSRETGALVQEQTASTLSRWETPLRIRLGGDGLRASDRASYRALSRRLTALTGVDVSIADGDEGEVSVYVFTEEERTAFREQLSAETDGARFQILTDWSDEFHYPCVAMVGFAEEGRGAITGAIIVIKAELEGVMRESCIHEELTQAMGLMNDHPDVRPSIFNDDEEFALLTKHDEALLRILYDHRLRPAMTLEEARPLIPEIVRDIWREGG